MEPEDEKILGRIRRQTGWTTSDAIKRGLRSLERDLAGEAASNAHAVYMSLDLGPGGYAAGPASETRETARRVIARKQQR
jgi:hypothetical protein